MKITDQLRDVLKITYSVNHATHREEAFGYCVELAKDMFNSPCVAVILFDESTEDLIIRTARGLSYTFIKEFRRPMGKDIMAEVIRAQQPMLINDISPESQFYPDLLLEHPLSSVMLAPISFDQHPAGILYISSPEKAHYQPDDRTLAAILGQILGFASQKERLVNLSRKLATMDDIAPIMTYTHFRERLQYEILRAKEFNYHLSLILLDIDHYKRYREVHGDKAGQELYKEIVEQIKEELDDIDLIGRHGLDEIIICKPESSYLQARDVTEKILKKIEQHALINDQHITLSAGVSSLGLESRDLITLLDSVRIALLKAQRAGRNQVALLVD